MNLLGNGTNDCEVVEGFLADHMPVVVEGTGANTGAVEIVGELHHGHGGDTPVLTISASQGLASYEAARRGDCKPLAEMLYNVATRYARGIAGGSAVQQFTIVLCRSGGKPSATLPFTRPSAPNVAGGAGAYGLAPESPTPARWGEIVLQNSAAKDTFLFQMMATMLKELRDNNVSLFAESRELFLALRRELERSMQQSHERRLKELEFLRTTEERRRLIKIVPALANAMTDKNIFPTSVEDSALMETLCENVSEEEIKMFATVLGARSPELSGLMMNRFHAIQKRKGEEMEELRRLAAEATGGTYDQAERDAMGQATQAPKTVEPMLVQSAPARDDHADTRLLDDFFGRLGDQAPVLLDMLQAQDPNLAERMRARRTATTNGGGAR